jgi:isochorismate hydrolase
MMRDIQDFNVEVDQAVLLVIDVQDRLAKVMPQDIFSNMLQTIKMLVAAAGHFQLPVLTTEQYPQGIGPTVDELNAVQQLGPVIEKVSFGCCGEPKFLSTILELERPQIIVTGMEAHVCVYQTVLELIKHDLNVHLVRDGICSRNAMDFKAAIHCARAAGAVVTTAETVMFQLLKGSKHPAFKAISQLVKERKLDE